MGKRAKTHSAAAQQEHWHRPTVKHLEMFSRDIQVICLVTCLQHSGRNLLTLMTTCVTCASLELSEPMLTATITCANVDFSTLSLWPLCVVPTSPHQPHWYNCVWTDYWNVNWTHLFCCCCLLNSAVLSVYFCVCVFVFFVLLCFFD